ncbi:MAG: thiamine phosphate synthase [Pseudomonadota bacterium]|jgi:thiamine-phosphate pyrophosphorylase|tara:strand:- start:911 stop:1492 length:582 start_codon:yes stop_codon:yes gene_type:complete
MALAISLPMPARHCKKSLPTLWLMTDERIGTDALMKALHHLPRGAGVVFRHYGLKRKARRRLFDNVRAVTRRRRLLLLLADDARTARAWKADGWHGRSQGPDTLIHSAPAHNVPEMRSAEQSGADILFVSPVFPTRSHPGSRTLGRVRFAMLARQANRPVIALGGMTASRWRGLHPSCAKGWAAIDGWLERAG